MSPINFATKGSDFKRLKPGTHIGVCDIVAVVGLQETFFGTKEQVYIRFEVPDERWKYIDKEGVDREGPGVIGNFYTASMSKKANLRKLLEGWRSKQFSEQEAKTFDIASILGKPCMLSVQESTSGENTYSNIASISPLPKGVSAPKAELPLLLYHEGDKSMFDKLPEWIRKKIETAVPEPDAEEPTIQRGDTDFDPLEITDADVGF